MKIRHYYNLAKNILFPICRSITGKGTVKTLKIIKKEFPKLKIKHIPTGKKVFDWKIPMEWVINDAYIIDKNEKKIIEFKKNNLHLVGYSQSINKKIQLKDLLKKIYTVPQLPKAIPYHHSYYKKNWGFCTTHEHKKKLIKNYNQNDLFKVVINSKLKKGRLSYGELVIKGRSKQEILISTYVCHPSMANNELSGPIVSMSLINYFQNKSNLKTLRFIFIPETIGSIAYLSKNFKIMKEKLIGGFLLSCIGDDRAHSCMLTKYGGSQSDKALLEVYKQKKIKFKTYPFLLRGSDERQFNSPGIDLPITSIFRSSYNGYKEYHTSLDDFKLVTLKGIKGGFEVAKKAIDNLQKRIIPISTHLCEPMLSKRKLHEGKITGFYNRKDINNTLNLLHFLQYSDGNNNLKDISKYIKLKYSSTLQIYKILKKNKLIY